jgi:hypothetical protein
VIQCQCSLHFHSLLFKISFSLPCYMLSQSYSPLFYYFNNSMWRCNLWRSLLCNCCHFFAPGWGSNIFLVALFADTINLRSRSRTIIRPFYPNVGTHSLLSCIQVWLSPSTVLCKERNILKLPVVILSKVPLKCGAASSGEEFPTFRRNVFLHYQRSSGKLEPWQRRYCLP